jgi:hypothetical protein
VSDQLSACAAGVGEWVSWHQQISRVCWARPCVCANVWGGRERVELIGRPCGALPSLTPLKHRTGALRPPRRAASRSARLGSRSLGFAVNERDFESAMAEVGRALLVATRPLYTAHSSDSMAKVIAWAELDATAVRTPFTAERRMRRHGH